MAIALRQKTDTEKEYRCRGCQCDQMATRFLIQHLTIYNNESLPKGMNYFPKYVEYFAKYCNKPSKYLQKSALIFATDISQTQAPLQKSRIKMVTH